MEKKPIIDWTLLGATAARSPPGWDPAGAGGGGTANPEINSQKADVWVWGNAGVVQGRSRGGASPGDSSGAGLPGPGGGQDGPPPPQHPPEPSSSPPSGIATAGEPPLPCNQAAPSGAARGAGNPCPAPGEGKLRHSTTIATRPLLGADPRGTARPRPPAGFYPDHPS